MQVATTYHPYQALLGKVLIIREQVEAARLALDLAHERLRRGLGSIVEMTQAETAVTRAETGLVIALYDAQTARAMLTYATGQSLDRYGPSMLVE